MFIDPKARVPVFLEEDSENIIYVKAKMDLATKTAAEVALLRINTGSARLARAAEQLALLQVNIVDWEGPAFEGRPATVPNINQLDPDWPLVAKVLDEIGRLNAGPEVVTVAANGTDTPKKTKAARR